MIIMKKLALILASLTFFAGCADNEAPDITETETEYGTEYGTGTPAPGEMGTDADADVTVAPVVPVVPVEPATGTEPGAASTSPGAQQGTTPQGNNQSLQSDQDIQIITTNELDAPTQSEQQGQPQNNTQPQP